MNERDFDFVWKALLAIWIISMVVLVVAAYFIFIH